jgi:hypothetical protein
LSSGWDIVALFSLAACYSSILFAIYLFVKKYLRKGYKLESC